MSQKTILCYGDSNTWGYIPAADHSTQKKRYLRSQRWPGILQELLGDEYYVIEEGLNSRTTNIDYEVPPDRNGKTYLNPCLYSHAPIDLVILALGGNDLKAYFNRSPQEIKAGLGELIDIIQASKYGPDLEKSPQILITTPAIPLDFVENYIDENGIYFLKGAVQKATALVEHSFQLSEEKTCEYLDVSSQVIPSKIDGIHYDEAGHKELAKLLSQKIKNILDK